MRHKFLIFFLIIPILVPVMLCVYHATFQGDEWRIKITGYDPRDLLRGRYIIFRYDYEDFKQGQKICFSGDLNKPNFQSYEEIQCDNPLTVDRMPQRYYIPENVADRADRLVRENSGDIRAGIIISYGKPVLKNLYYKDDTILDYLKSQN